MNTSSPSSYVREASAHFFNQLSHLSTSTGYLINADSKHQAIVGSARYSFSLNDLKNWDCQGDLGAPPQFSARSLFSYNHFSPFQWLKEQARSYVYKQWQGYYDDIRLLHRLGYIKYLVQSPVHEVLGSTSYSHHTFANISFTANTRWLRYSYFTGVISENNLLSSDNPVWIDVGSFYGGVQYIVNRSTTQPIRNILVDFEHQLSRAYCILSYHFPSSHHYLYSGSGKAISLSTSSTVDINSISGSSFLYCPASLYSSLSSSQSTSPDLFTNFFSLGEMSQIHFKEYLSSSLFQNSAHHFLVNRFVSSPFFEPTYDSNLTILDYMRYISSDSIDLTVCPIHHYQLVPRTVNGSFASRPVSSSYFQLLCSSIKAL